MQDLGEDTFPEPKQSATPDDASSLTADIAPEGTATASEPVESSQESTSTTDETPLEPPPPNKPTPETDGKKSVTTNERKPMTIPSSVHVRITPDNLKDYVGPPVYQKDRLYTHAPPPGVSTGLGYLGNGSGAVMPIEAMVSPFFFLSVFVFHQFIYLLQSMPGKGGLQLTGKLGEVIRESAQIGLSWVKSHAYDLGITPSEDEQFLTDRDIHVHMPEGSIGKEGPSAGTAIVSAFVSLFTKTKVNPDIGTFFISLVFALF